MSYDHLIEEYPGARASPTPSLCSADTISIPSDFDPDEYLLGSHDPDGDSRVSDVGDSSKEGLLTDGDRGCSEESDQDISDSTKKPKRRRRRGFKGGLLRRPKYYQNPSRSSSRSSSRSRSPSKGRAVQDCSGGVEGVLDANLSDNEDAGYAVSCASTLPSEAEKTDYYDDEESNENAEKTSSRSRLSRRKRWRRTKFDWSQASSPDKEVSDAADGIDNQSERIEGSTPGDEKDADSLPAHSASVTPQSPLSEVLSKTVSFLKVTLKSDWMVSCEESIISVFKIANPVNPFVERAITWDGRRVNFLIHNQKLHSKNILWEFKKPDPRNSAKIADFLTSVSNSFLLFEICTGVQSHQDQWHRFSDNSFTENHYSTPVLRSSNCHLLRNYAGRCGNCHRILKTMLEYERRKKNRSDSDLGKINNRYLTKEDLEKKTNYIQQEKKLANQQVRRLKKRIATLLKEKHERIESQLSEDFVKIMDDNVDKMTNLEKLFWEQQSIALKKRGALKTMRWHPSMIRLALQLRMLSPAAYDFMKGVLSLPSERRLFDYTHFTEVKEGLQEDLLVQFDDMVQKNCPNEHEKYFNLLLDEMSIRSGLVYNAHSGELIGFENLSSTEEELASLEAEIQGLGRSKKLAKKALVFMLTGAQTDIRFVPAVYFSDDLSAAQLYSRTWDVIYAVEETEAKVLTVICDGASINRKFINMHFNCGETPFVHNTMNSASGESSRKLFFMLDPPHLIKTFRNCFANSFAHRNSRELCINNQVLSWKAIVALLNVMEGNKFKETKLTKAHVYLTSFSCMKVAPAVQVFSNSVIKALHKYKESPTVKEHYNEELIRFLFNMNRWFDCFNGGVESKKKLKNPDLLEYTNINDDRFNFLQTDFLNYLEEWENFVANREGRYTKDQRSRMIISYQSLEGIKISIHSFIAVTKFLLEKGAPSVSARKFNQDPLEQYFSDQRRVRGADDHPTAAQVLHSRLSFHVVGQMSAGGKRSNTEDLRKMEVDSSLLPTRKKTKK